MRNLPRNLVLRSVALWNQTPYPTPEEDLPKKASSGAFHQLKKEVSVGTDCTTIQGVMNRAVPPPPPVIVVASNSTAKKGIGNKKKRQSERKARRNWSPEMHKRLLQALEQLGHSRTKISYSELRKWHKILR